VKPELQSFLVFIDFSASVRVLNAVLMTVSPVGFSAKGHPKNPLSFVTRMTEQRLLYKSCTTQYSSAAYAGVASTARPKVQMIAFFIRSSKVPPAPEHRVAGLSSASDSVLAEHFASCHIRGMRIGGRSTGHSG